MCYKKKGIYMLQTTLTIPPGSSLLAKILLTQMGTLHYQKFTRHKFTLEMNGPAPGGACCSVSGSTILTVLHWCLSSSGPEVHPDSST